MSDGGGCKCAASSYADCGCDDVDWTPQEVYDLRKEVAKWKNNHDNAVKRCALLRERPDLPVDRIPAYQEMIKLQNDVECLTKLRESEEAYKQAQMYAHKVIELEYKIEGLEEKLKKDNNPTIEGVKWYDFVTKLQKRIEAMEGVVAAANLLNEKWNEEDTTQLEECEMLLHLNEKLIQLRKFEQNAKDRV